MSNPKKARRLVDHLRDLPPLPPRPPRKVDGDSAFQRLKRRLEWPDEWDLSESRCRGINGIGSQCGRRIRADEIFCYAHPDQTAETVTEARRAHLEAQVRDPSETPAVSSPEDRPRSSRGTQRSSGRGRNLRAVPDDRRCTRILRRNEPGERRCSNWTVTVDDGEFDAFCVTHSKHPRAKRAREVAAEVGAAGLRRKNAYDVDARKPIFNGDLKTQDDVASARLALLRKLEIGAVGASNANAMFGALKDASSHIERYGAHQGAEGGAGVLRLLPGMKLAEMDQEIDYVLTKADLETIDAGLIRDEKAGLSTPVEIDEIILKYLGFRTRKRDRPRTHGGS